MVGGGGGRKDGRAGAGGGGGGGGGPGGGVTPGTGIPSAWGIGPNGDEAVSGTSGPGVAGPGRPGPGAGGAPAFWCAPPGGPIGTAGATNGPGAGLVGAVSC
jgi:hypothetical protein